MKVKIMYNKEAKDLSYKILLDIENNKKDLQLLCLQSSRLSLLLNNYEKSEKFTKVSKEIINMESFLNSYGVVVENSLKNINPDKIYSSINSFISDFHIQKLNTSIYGPKIRKDIREDIEKYEKFKYKILKVKSDIYEYAMNIYYQLEFTKDTLDIFSDYETIVNNKLPKFLLNSKEKLDSISKNLKSQNKEDWSNSVHTCRKLLQNLADKLYPHSDDKIKKDGKTINIGKGDYINRLMNYIDDNSNSDKFRQITGSSLKYIGERLDAIYESANKGTHETINTLEEAKRYVIYTYLIIGDILSLDKPFYKR
jgi:hypothetical protein